MKTEDFCKNLTSFGENMGSVISRCGKIGWGKIGHGLQLYLAIRLFVKLRGGGYKS